MKYIIDAQLPRSLAKWMVENDYEAVHTLDLPDKNNTSDSEIIRIASLDDVSIVVSKDKDFPEQRIIRGLPKKLLWVTTGNIKNNQLLKIFESEFEKINSLFEEGFLFVELSNENITIHS